jgi:hypothetical protein
MSCFHGNHEDGCEICEEVNAAFKSGYEAAIEATIDKVLACYSPDDTAQDWADKIAAIRSMK